MSQIVFFVTWIEVSHCLEKVANCGELLNQMLFNRTAFVSVYRICFSIFSPAKGKTTGDSSIISA